MPTCSRNVHQCKLVCVVSETSIKYTFVLGGSVPIFLNILNGGNILIIKRTALELGSKSSEN